ncbi:hypothetical protein GGD38_002225 [Chitinophagaceae bacterium OAS944]|nr:hypothetical protein [Chitinophagaceae bacterium OAS944]
MMPIYFLNMCVITNVVSVNFNGTLFLVIHQMFFKGVVYCKQVLSLIADKDMKTKPENILRQPDLGNASEGTEEQERTPVHPESFFWA